LRAAGWSDEGIHDAVQVVAYFNYINPTADALRVTPGEGPPAVGTTLTAEGRATAISLKPSQSAVAPSAIAGQSGV
jgi:hypothetical protein